MTKKQTLQSRCKICSLIQRDKKAYIRIHRQVLGEGLTKKQVRLWLNDHVDVLNADLKEGEEPLAYFNATNFSKHFKSHVSDMKKMEAAVKKAMRPKSEQPETTFTPEEVAIARTTGEPDEDEYISMSQMIKELEDSVKIGLKTFLTNSKKGMGSPALHSQQVEQQQKVIANMLDLKAKLAKVQVTEKVAGEALRLGIQMLVKAMMDQLFKTANEMKVSLRTSFPTGTYPEEMRDSVMRCSEVIKTTVPEILEVVWKEYGIR